jgi:hypothetical protein
VIIEPKVANGERRVGRGGIKRIVTSRPANILICAVNVGTYEEVTLALVAQTLLRDVIERPSGGGNTDETNKKNHDAIDVVKIVMCHDQSVQRRYPQAVKCEE